MANDEQQNETLTCERCSATCEETLTVVTYFSHYGYSRPSQNKQTQEWCESCANSYAFKCDDCTERWSVDYRALQDRYVSICSKCCDSWHICEDCNRVMHSDNSYYCEHHDASYCENCAHDSDCGHSSNLIHDYSYKPTPIFHGGKGIIHYGVELEVDTDLSTAGSTLEHLGGTDERHAYLKEDGSIDEGYEIVTHPHTLEAHRALWEHFFRYANRAGLDASNNGMHVHCQRQYLTRYRVGLMQAFLNSEANAPFVRAIADRSCTNWCSLKPELGKVSASDSDRYQALNTSGSRTVEIRIFRGTTVKSRFFANLEFCDALVSFTAACGYSHLTVDDFCRHVRKYRKLWRYLDARLVELGYLAPIATKEQKMAQCAKKETPACV